MDGQIKLKRLFMMAAGALAIFFTGYPHIWSVYQPYIIKETGWSQSQAAMCFYIALITFVIGNMVGGKLQDKYSPRCAIFWGGMLFSLGILLSAISLHKSPFVMYLTYGGLQGIGQGAIYTTIISTAQKWFPTKTGFASGIVVTANGLCGFFLAPFSRYLLNGYGISTTFLVIGGMVVVSWILASIFVVNPIMADQVSKKIVKEKECTIKSNNKDDSKHLRESEDINNKTTGQMIKTPQFYLLVGTMMCGLVSYFLVSPISQTLQIERGVPENLAISAVMVGSLVNAAARLLLPSLADNLGRIPCLRIILCISFAGILLVLFSTSYITTLAIVITYGCYGGILGSFPALTSSIFGIKHSGSNYGVVIFGFGAAAIIAPTITKIVGQLNYENNAVFIVAAVFALISIILITKLNHVIEVV